MTATLTTIEVTWGERLDVELGRWSKETGCKITPLFKAVGMGADVRENTIGNLRVRAAAPTGKQARYAWLLLTVMGRKPEAFGVVAEWPDSLSQRRQLKVALETLGRLMPGGTSEQDIPQNTCKAA